MKRVVLLFGLLLLATGVYAQSTIPGGTILPVVLTTSIDSSKAAAGDVVTGMIAQDVPLGSETIHRGTKVVGKVLSAGAAKNGGGATLSFQFDQVQLPDRAVPITTDLRALASFVEVFDAKLPDPSQEGRLPAAWTYDQIGGNEAVYAGGGDVRDGIQKTGIPFGDGVLAEVRHDPGTKCRGPIEGNDKSQAMWEFASDACGVFGFDQTEITHAGRTSPMGQIVLTSQHGSLVLKRGAGMLLRVIGNSNAMASAATH